MTTQIISNIKYYMADYMKIILSESNITYWPPRAAPVRRSKGNSLICPSEGECSEHISPLLPHLFRRYHSLI